MGFGFIVKSSSVRVPLEADAGEAMLQRAAAGCLEQQKQLHNSRIDARLGFRAFRVAELSCPKISPLKAWSSFNQRLLLGGYRGVPVSQEALSNRAPWGLQNYLAPVVFAVVIALRRRSNAPIAITKRVRSTYMLECGAVAQVGFGKVSPLTVPGTLWVMTGPNPRR